MLPSAKIWRPLFVTTYPMAFHADLGQIGQLTSFCGIFRIPNPTWIEGALPINLKIDLNCQVLEIFEKIWKLLKFFGHFWKYLDILGELINKFTNLIVRPALLSFLSISLTPSPCTVKISLADVQWPTTIERLLNVVTLLWHEKIVILRNHSDAII